MCLTIADARGRAVKITTKGYITKPQITARGRRWVKIAPTDMIVYKALTRKGNGKNIYYISPYMYYRYDIGDEVYRDGNGPDFTFHTGWNNEIQVNDGLHAFVDFRSARGLGPTVGMFVIPKGSSYILGTDNDIVCNRYIFKQIVK